jgi:hypothetical protein
MEKTSFTLGHDLGAVGRWSRIVIGALGFAWAVSVSLEQGLVLQTGLYVVAIAFAYLVAHRLLGERVLGRMNPWVGTFLLVGPAVVIPGIQALPLELRLGMVAYFTASLFLNAAANYGGCEVLALPSLLFRRWYTVYCPLNVIDVAERAIAGESAGRAPETRGA